MSTPNLPNVREPFIDARSGQISRPWWIFLQQLMAQIGGDIDLSAIEQALRAAIRDILDLQRQEVSQDVGRRFAEIQEALSQSLAALAGEGRAHGRWADPDLHALATTTSAGFMSPSDKQTVISSVPSARQIIAGNGLTGGGDLTADRTLNVVAEDASVVVNPDGIRVGVLQTDTQHGSRAGGALHAEATRTVAGFMSAADKTKLDYISSSNFYVYQLASAQSIAAATFTILNFDTVGFDDTGEFDMATDTFSPDIAGHYVFNGSVYGTQGATANRALDLYVNGTSVRRLAQRNDVGTSALGGSSGPVALSAGDLVTLRYFTSIADITSNQANATFFSGWRIK